MFNANVLWHAALPVERRTYMRMAHGIANRIAQTIWRNGWCIDVDGRPREINRRRWQICKKAIVVQKGAGAFTINIIDTTCAARRGTHKVGCGTKLLA